MQRFFQDLGSDYPVYVFVRDRAAALGGQRGHLEKAIDETIDQFGIQRRAVQRKFYSMARGERMFEEINASVALDGAMRTALNSALEERIAAAELQPDEVKELRAISNIPFMFRLLDALIKSKRRNL